jgi:mono/diheme cytochrome c family protein
MLRSGVRPFSWLLVLAFSLALRVAADTGVPEPEGTSPRRVRWAEVQVDPVVGKPERLAKSGKAVFEQHCSVCHGKEGKGDGPAALVLSVPPRNFTGGMFKFKTSGQGEMPHDDDLYRTITAGIAAAGMPSFGDLTPFERWSLVAYVKKLACFTLDDGQVFSFFEKRPPKARKELPVAPAPGTIDLARGAVLYRTEVQCLKCHGEKGVGDGPSAAELVDAFEVPIKAADLTRGEVTFKTGFKAEDIYRVLTNGMAGTPMPAFINVSDQDRWNLAFYVVSLYRPIPPGERLFLRVGCISCHTIGKGKLIGPDLTGVTQRRDPEWLKKWLKDPPSLLATDATARKLLEEYLTPMPSYGLTDAEVDLLVGFLATLPPAPSPADAPAK